MDQKSPPTGAMELPRDDAAGRRVPIPTPGRPELSTLQQVRREMASLYHAAQRGDISTVALRNSIYALSQIAKLIEIDRLESRMEALQKMAAVGERTH